MDYHISNYSLHGLFEGDAFILKSFEGDPGLLLSLLVQFLHVARFDEQLLVMTHLAVLYLVHAPDGMYRESTYQSICTILGKWGF